MDQEQSTNAGQESQTTKKLSPAAVICIVLLLVVISLTAVLIWFLTRQDDRDDVTSGRGTVVTQDNVSQLIAEAEQNADTAYTVSMNIEWDFENGTSPSTNAYVENDTSNLRTVYFNVLLADTSELVYSSPYIPVGSTLTGFALDKDLEAGDYLAVVEYHLVDDDQQELSTVSVTTTLHILN